MESSMIPLNAPPSYSREEGPVVMEIVEQPRDYIVWSVASLFYGNPCCLGLLAFYYSIKSRDRMLMGDITGAKAYGSKARCANGWATVLFIILIVILIVLRMVTLLKILQIEPSD